jgi:predicted DNA-binding transcriptional regulator
LQNITVKDPNLVLKGNTLKIYMYILRKNNESVGVREVQRELNLSSPTLAKYHLERLVEIGLVSQAQDGSYALLKEVKVDLLKPFLRLGSHIIPRLITYAVMITILFTYYAIVVIPTNNLQFDEFFGINIGVLALISLWYETYRSWRSVPT